MCLTVDKRFHSPIGQAFIATEDLWVYKILERVNKKNWETPYRHMEVNFNEPYTVKYMHPNSQGEVDEGFHAFAVKTPGIPYKDHKRFIAVIPKGTRYYVGDDCDIVAEKMIILNKRHVYPWEKKHLFKNSLVAKAYNINWREH